MDGSDAAQPRRPWVRTAVFAGLVVVAGLALPLSAFVVEAVSSRAENWIIVVQLAITALVGAGAGALLPALGPPAASRGRRATTWAAFGLLAAAVADALWLVVLAG